MALTDVHFRCIICAKMCDQRNRTVRYTVGSSRTGYLHMACWHAVLDAIPGAIRILSEERPEIVGAEEVLRSVRPLLRGYCEADDRAIAAFHRLLTEMEARDGGEG